MAQNTYGPGAAHSNSEDSIGTGNHARREKIRSRCREAGTCACDISPTLNELKETQNTERRDIVTANAISRGKRPNTNGR